MTLDVADWVGREHTADLRRRCPRAPHQRPAACPRVRGDRVGVPDVDETARALIWMDERYLVEAFGRAPQADPAVVVDVLTGIWVSVLYGTRPAD